MRIPFIKTSLFLVFTVSSLTVAAQDERAQIPRLLQKSFVEVNIGSINYPFSAKELEPGFQLQSVVVPHTAVRLVLFGYEFNKYLSAQISYMRPVLWVKYQYLLDNIIYNRTVWMNVGGLTIKRQFPIGKRFSIYGEGGLGVITRHGITDGQGRIVIKDANYATFLLGTGLKYHVNEHWALQLMLAYSPPNKKSNQPYTSFISPGFSYRLLTRNAHQLKKAATNGHIFPKQMMRLGFTSNFMGYGINNFLSQGKIPVFWGGSAEVNNGISWSYQRNVYHGAKVFALDWGTNISIWETDKLKNGFFTLSVYPVLRFNFLHTKAADFYFYYSVAGPSFISGTLLDGYLMGAHFTFQDTMGTGIFLGKQRRFNGELKIGHYSNGNIYTENEAVKVPLSIELGYTF